MLVINGALYRESPSTLRKAFCILHKLNCSGDTFRLLGVLVDPKLSMNDEMHRIRKKNAQRYVPYLTLEHTTTRLDCCNNTRHMYCACWNNPLWLCFMLLDPISTP